MTNVVGAVLILTLYFTHNFYVKSPKNINTLSLIQTQMLE